MPARVEYSFTFTNADPDQRVSFDTDSAVYASETATERQEFFELDADSTITVWSDAATLTAVTTDGLGAVLRATATHDSPSVTSGDGTAPANPSHGGGSSVASDYLIAAAAATGSHTSGEDFYPDLTVTAVSGSTVTLDEDGKTLHMAAGVYDVSIAYGVVPVDAGGRLLVYMDGLGAVFGTLVDLKLPGGNDSYRDVVTAQGVVLAAGADAQFNVQLNGVAWDLSDCSISLRRIGDVPA